MRGVAVVTTMSRMSATTTAPTRPATPAQLDWLERELRHWEADGLLHDGQAAAIRHRYHAERRFSIARLMLGLGACFVGVGLIWLVAANLDQLSPALRFGVVSCLWLVTLAAGEALHDRRVTWLVVGPVRLLAALALGAVVFQAAQSLQVPAYEPALVGLWGLGALVHAYVVRATGPLLVGIGAVTTWYVWATVWDAPGALAAVVSVGLAAVVAAGLGAVHLARLPRFSAPWREVGATLALGVLFVAALPFVTADGLTWSPWLVGGVVAATAALTAAWLWAPGTARLEPLGAAAVLGLSVLLVLWEAGTDADRLGVAGWAHAGLAVAAYVTVAIGVAVLGILRDSWRLTAISTAAIVLFTTVQSFAVFAQIIQGAWLFVALGLVLLGTGFLFDRARRELAATLEGDDR
jgi:uncharacterized membrane protein